MTRSALGRDQRGEGSFELGVLVVATLALTSVALPQLGRVMTSRFLPMPTDRAALVRDTPRLGEYDVADTPVDAPWWQHLTLGDLPTVATEIAGFTWVAVESMPAGFVDAVTTLPELVAVLWEQPTIALEIGVDMVAQIKANVATVATTSDRAAALQILGSTVADNLPFEKVLAFTALAKASRLRKVTKTSHALTEVATSRSARSLGRLEHAPVPSGAWCFTAETEVHTPTGLRAIRDVKLGDRVMTADGSVANATEVDPSWRRIELEMEDPRSANGKLIVSVLRSPMWVERARAQAGGTIDFELSEMQIRGEARVTSIGDAPTITSGNGRVVLSTIESESTAVIAISFRGTDETLEPTAGHRLYSLDRKAWVPAGKLRIGERLRAIRGEAVVASIKQKPGTHTVYNIEVETEHEYLVSKLGVRSHNDGCGPGAREFGAAHEAFRERVRLSFESSIERARRHGDPEKRETLEAAYAKLDDPAFAEAFRSTGHEEEAISRFRQHLFANPGVNLEIARDWTVDAINAANRPPFRPGRAAVQVALATWNTAVTAAGAGTIFMIMDHIVDDEPMEPPQQVGRRVSTAVRSATAELEGLVFWLRVQLQEGIAIARGPFRNVGAPIRPSRSPQQPTSGTSD